MKTFKQILCCVLTVLMLSGVLLTAPTAYAAETSVSQVGAKGSVYSGKTGDCTWRLDTSTGVLSISGTGSMDYKRPWKKHSYYIKTVNIANGLTKVTIQDGVTDIGRGAFCRCKSLSSVTLPDSMKRIRKSAFLHCDKLKTVYYKGSENQWKNIDIETGNEPLTKAKVYYI